VRCAIDPQRKHRGNCRAVCVSLRLVAITVSSARVGVLTMNQQPENKSSLQNEPNKLNSSKGELNEKELNEVSGGRKDREQDQPGNEMAH
jgi:bacteriocin-like protein